MVVCKHVIYRGRVQGVGFRYTALEIAESFAIKGYVRNLPNGEVELAAEGPAEVVQSYLATLAERMAGHIRQSVVSECSPAGYRDFQILH